MIKKNIYINFKKLFLNAFLFLQLGLFLNYFFINIENIGGVGIALPVLITFLSLGMVVVFYKYLQSGVALKNSFVFFLLLIGWIAIRFVNDYEGIEELKQHTIATTGGMLLFYVIGMIVRVLLSDHNFGCRKLFLFFSLIYFMHISWIFIKFSNRISADLLLLEDGVGAHQRPGNFVSMTFIVYSYIYVLSVIKNRVIDGGRVYLFISTTIYLICAGVLFLESQLMGSNSATFVVMILGLLSTGVSFLLSRKDVIESYKIKTGMIFEFKSIFKIALYYLFASTILGLFFLVLTSLYIDLDVSKIRIFGFGNAENSSFNTRFEILSKWGWEQVSFAPIFGNANVAYLVTGDASFTLHNFFPDIQASLGLIGLISVLIIFFYVFKSLYKRATRVYGIYSSNNFFQSSIAFYSIWVILLFLIFANMSVGFSWPVIWFAIGFLSDSLSTPSR